MARRGDQPADNNRIEQLKTIAAEFCRVHDEWCEAKNRPHPDEIYWDAVDALRDAFENGDIPGDCRQLAEAVTQFSEAVEEFDERDDAKQLYPDDPFWAARERVAAALAAFTAHLLELPPLESIAQLAALPAMTHLQIAKIYGFKDAHGNWLTHLVQRELDKPGSVLKAADGVDGKPWRDPRIKDDGNAAAENRTKALEQKQRAARKPAKPCPESPKELWAQQVGIKQAAKMLGRPETEVAELFAEFDAEHEAQLTSGEVEDAATQAIKELKNAGKTIKQIAETLNLPERQVADALKPKPAAAK